MGAFQQGSTGAATGFAIGGPIGAIIGGALGFLGGLFGGGKKKLEEAINRVGRGVESLSHGFLNLGQFLAGLARKVLGALKHLKDLKWASIWRALKRFYDRYQKAIAFWNRHILGPIDQIRRTLDHLYNTIFGPIVQTLDSFRRVTQLIGIFNRKLAQEIDSRIFGLEAKILEPLTMAYRRINGLTSVVRAVVTRLGLFDRSIFIETARRDARILIGVLTNPRRRVIPHVTNPGLPDLGKKKADLAEFAASRSGPMADTQAALLLHFRETLSRLS